MKEPSKLAAWDEPGVLLPDEERESKGFGQMVSLGKAFLLSRDMKPWDGILPIDRANPGYLTAIVRTKVKP